MWKIWILCYWSQGARIKRSKNFQNCMGRASMLQRQNWEYKNSRKKWVVPPHCCYFNSLIRFRFQNSLVMCTTLQFSSMQFVLASNSDDWDEFFELNSPQIFSDLTCTCPEWMQSRVDRWKQSPCELFQSVCDSHEEVVREHDTRSRLLLASCCDVHYGRGMSRDNLLEGRTKVRLNSGESHANSTLIPARKWL